MKQPYKIQNRTSESRRVKFVKNGGTVSFPKTPTASFVENSREAGFCLTAITPLPQRDNATNTITLTSHPMGTDGRVSLYINDTLIESKRFLNKNRVADRQAWFNSEFGAYALYSGKELATFTTALVSADTYRFVFEDDDLDYVFGGTTNAVGDVNPTLIVEQYRLAFNIMNNKIEISCDGAEFESPYMALTGDWQLEINGEKYTTLNTPIEEMLALIAATDVGVVYEGEEPEPEPEPEVITDYTLTGWYNSELERFEGFIRPGVKVDVYRYPTTGDGINVTTDIVLDGLGRWHYNHNTENVLSLDLNTYRGDLIADPDNVEWGEYIEITDFTLPAYRKADGEVIHTYGKTLVNTGDAHLYFKIGNGELLKEQLPFGSILNYGEEYNLNTYLATFANEGDLDDPVGPLGKFFMSYTNTLGLLGNYAGSTDPSFVDFTFLTPKPGLVPLVEPVTVTLYRGLASNSTDLFDLLFPGVVENYVTLTATATVEPTKYLTSTPYFAVTEGELVQFWDGPFGNALRIIDATNVDDLKSKLILAKDFVPTSNTTVDYTGWYDWNMAYSQDGQELAITLGGSPTPTDTSLVFTYQRTAPGVFESPRSFELDYRTSGNPSINSGIMTATNWASYTVYRPSLNPTGLEYANDWGFSDSIQQIFRVDANLNFVLTFKWDGMAGMSGYMVHQVIYNSEFNNFNVSTAEGYIQNPTNNGFGSIPPTMAKLSETRFLSIVADKLVLFEVGLDGASPTFTDLGSNDGRLRGVTVVSRTDTEVYLIITDNSTQTYRYFAMNVNDLSERAISTGNIYPDLGGDYGYQIGDGVVVFLRNDWGGTPTFVTFDQETGVVKQNNFQPK